MADIEITALPEDTAPTPDDLLITVDDPEGGLPITKKVIIANLSKALGWVDVRSFMDGVAGRPTYATWYADQTTTDVSSVLAAAAAAAAAGTLFIPSGFTFLGSNTDITANMIVTGGGILKSNVLGAGTGSPIFNVTGNDVTIDGIKFDGQKGAQPADGFADSYDGGVGGLGRAYRAAIKMNSGGAGGWEGLTVKNCSFHDIYGASVATDGVSKVRVENNIAEDCNFELAFFYDTHSLGIIDCHILGNRCYNIGSGDGSFNAESFLISNCTGGLVSNNIVNTVERAMLKLENPTQIDVTGNVAKTTGTIGQFAAVQLQSVSANINITGNIINGCTFGVLITGIFGSSSATNINISNNTIENVNTGGGVCDAILMDINCTNLNITGNIIKDGHRHGIRLDCGNNILIQGNIIEEVATYGIYLAHGLTAMDSINICGNTILNVGLSILVHLTGGALLITNLAFRNNIIGNDGVSPTNGFFQIGDGITTGVVENNTFNDLSDITIVSAGCLEGANIKDGAWDYGAFSPP